MDHNGSKRVSPKLAQLVGCSRSTVASIYAKRINDFDISCRRQGVGHPCVIKEKERRRLSRLVKQNRRQTVAQLTAQYNAVDTVGYGTVQQTSHSCASVDQASSSTTPTVGLGTSKLDHG
ncbi:hypothetical protein AVEN_92510-1 [Araneus ventricosus]|uniref:Transposase Tc1-like domain-containing protein n=1 Tax=Araneus ventricosus TaxID=182803 RepID=A0A4Y2AJ42_ARAVE|nr:hypothetical protein AVEN_92510-1 [Araneus ventricosus]